MCDARSPSRIFLSFRAYRSNLIEILSFNLIIRPPGKELIQIMRVNMNKNKGKIKFSFIFGFFRAFSMKMLRLFLVIPDMDPTFPDISDCREMPGNVGKCREMSGNVGKS